MKNGHGKSYENCDAQFTLFLIWEIEMAKDMKIAMFILPCFLIWKIDIAEDMKIVKDMVKADNDFYDYGIELFLGSILPLVMFKSF